MDPVVARHGGVVVECSVVIPHRIFVAHAGVVPPGRVDGPTAASTVHDDLHLLVSTQ